MHYQGLFYILKIIQIELISRYHNDLLVGHFGIEKTRKFVAQKYYWPSLYHNVEDYIKGCDICLTSKAVQHKLYGNLQSLPVSIYRWKDLSMDFVTGLLILTDWKGDSYNSILVIVNRLTKIVYYKLIKVTINALGLTEIIIDMVVRHYDLPDSIVTDQRLLFTSKFWSLLCYFLDTKQKLSTAFYPQTDGQTKK